MRITDNAFCSGNKEWIECKQRIEREKKVCIEWKTLCATAVLSVCPVLSCNKYLYRQSLAKLLTHCSNSVPSLHAHPFKRKEKNNKPS